MNFFLENRFFSIIFKIFLKIKFFFRNHKIIKKKFRCLFLLKLRELTWIISKIWMYYARHNNTKYYLIASYLLGKPTNSRTRQKIQQNLMKCIKVQNQSRTKLIKWDSSRSIKWIYFVKKRLIDNALHKHYEINQKNNCQPHKFRIE